jgi:hypothetical protein
LQWRSGLEHNVLLLWKHLTKTVSFVIAQHEFRRVRDSLQSCCSISLCHRELGSKLQGYWFYTIFDLCVKSFERWLQRARVTGDAQNGVDFNGPPLTIAIFSGIHTVFTLPPFFFSVEPVASKFRTQGLDGMGWWNSTIAMNPELSSKFTLSDHKTVTVFVICFHSKSMLCFSLRLRCNQNALKLAAKWR